MSINRRRHVRLTLEIPSFRVYETGERTQVMVYQISIGGCFIEWEEHYEPGEEFRLEIPLPNKNFLPLECRALYLFEEDGIGVQFQNISQFEQELIAQVMAKSLAEKGIPLTVDPFSAPKFFDFDKTDSEKTNRVKFIED